VAIRCITNSGDTALGDTRGNGVVKTWAVLSPNVRKYPAPRDPTLDCWATVIDDGRPRVALLLSGEPACCGPFAPAE
jgi:hypothetical protein